jgi:hypothetical protein
MAIKDLTDQELMTLARRLGIPTTNITGKVSPLAGLIDYTKAPYGGATVSPMTLPAAQQFSPLGLTVGAPQVTISPEASDLVRQQFDAMRTLGAENLLQTARTAAGRQGMRLMDTPIGDPLLRSQAQLESQLGGQEAAAMLGLSTDLRDFLQNQAVAQEEAIARRYGLDANQALNRAKLLEAGAQWRGELGQLGGQFQEQALIDRSKLIEQARQEQGKLSLLERQGTRTFDENVRRFQEQLRQNAFTNRLNLLGNISELGLGLGRQAGGGGTTTRYTPPNLVGGLGTMMSGLEAFGTGLGGINELNRAYQMLYGSGA